MKQIRLFINIFLICIGILIQNSIKNNGEMFIAIVPLLFTYVFIINLRPNENNSQNILVYFLVMSFCFLYSNFIVDFFGNINLEIDYFFKHKYLLEDKIFVNSLIFWNLIAIESASLIKVKDKKIKVNIQNKKNQERFYLLLKIIFIIFLFSGIYMTISTIKLGYMSIYTGDLREKIGFIYKMNLIINLLISLLIPINISIFLKNKKKLKKILVIYLLWSLILSLGGSRSALLSSSIFSVWFFGNIWRINYLKKIKIILIVVILLLVSIGVINFYRDKNNTIYEIFNFKYYLAFFLNQGITGLFLIVPQKFPMLYSFNSIRFPFFMSFISLDIESFTNKFSGQTKIFAEKTSILEHKMSYLVNEQDYLNGFGMGGSYLLEAYDLFGIVGIYILTFFMIYLLRKSEQRFNKVSNLKASILIYWVQNIFMTPRGNYLGIRLRNILLMCLLYLLIDAFNKIKLIKINKKGKK